MTRNYNRTNLYCFFELSDKQQAEILDKFNFDISDAENTLYAIIEAEDMALPLSAFLRTGGNFTHGIFSDSYFSGYFLTLSKCGTHGTIAYKYF
jgi:hypothetical protein